MDYIITGTYWIYQYACGARRFVKPSKLHYSLSLHAKRYKRDSLWTFRTTLIWYNLAADYPHHPKVR